MTRSLLKECLLGYMTCTSMYRPEIHTHPTAQVICSKSIRVRMVQNKVPEGVANVNCFGQYVTRLKRDCWTALSRIIGRYIGNNYELYIAMYV